MSNHTFFACLLGMSLVSCSRAQQQKIKEFHLPDVPVTLTASENKAAYLSLHYWDHFDFVDMPLTSRPEITGQAFVDLPGILSYTDRTQAAIDTLFRRIATGQEMLYHFIGLSDRYLYKPNSPVYDEELHILVSRTLLDNPYLSGTDKIHPRYLLEIAMKNRPGDVAANFTVTCRDGRRKQLSGIKADCVLVYFSDPDCGGCRRVKELLTLSPIVSDLLESGRLKLLPVCVKNKTSARGEAEFSAGWTDSYDANQRLAREQVYGLRMMPTLHLLDAEKWVIFKDASLEQVRERLS